MTLSEIPATEPGAASRTVACADDARHLGFTNVQTGYEPASGMHVVTGDYPPQAGQRIADHLLGR